MKQLHIAQSIKLVTKHRQFRATIESTKDVINELSRAQGKTLSDSDARLIEALEKASGLTIQDLAKLTKNWPT